MICIRAALSAARQLLGAIIAISSQRQDCINSVLSLKNKSLLLTTSNRFKIAVLQHSFSQHIVTPSA